ncbi:ribosome biogenesis GTPase [Lactobacillus bombicola]|uniref:Small ribosomal subunit biogenesis GTPase RsgA n=1 Tax=Lactobacillus bombicola TaxID=1505723 RepID=A0A1I1S838_9LACO|nr:ribosome small subunit-dependent GTPase A [Lactobacillus bombicola]MCO6527925.1 ribosome small subunit-dependent GTPase A [Lactobacillus sp.]RHW50957.1 ribosome small subunit-dependent GTPase A [Lactobacillus bombicola]RHW52784.1 ribosome small subunit-dependent GTPase A [Lactobacillus bombicola]RHW55354.1 ribosome small subunit-dependent GTPase A [Lactobacillus bombicola]SFD40778.1 ribosome biogenesis GTPase [Lactobacillus bombicola]
MNKQVEGIIVSSIAGFYDVQTSNGIERTRARGIFRKNKQKPTVGDRVKIQLDEHGMNYLVEVYARTNLIGRPAVANVDQVLLVISAVEPEFSLQLLDRYLTFFSWQKVAVSIYLSKTDLVSAPQLTEIKQNLNYYAQLGYQVVYNWEDFAQNLATIIKPNQIWTLAGQSGAGKSTLINHLKKSLKQKTAAISSSLNRGKHTTRTVQLFRIGHGYLADTPGFSAIDFTPIKINELCNYFVEFKRVSSSCKFRGCQHLKEPKCEVKNLVEKKQIKQSRYDNYLLMRTEIEHGRLPEYLK